MGVQRGTEGNRVVLWGQRGTDLLQGDRRTESFEAYRGTEGYRVDVG